VVEFGIVVGITEGKYNGGVGVRVALDAILFKASAALSFWQITDVHQPGIVGDNRDEQLGGL
jgi:hypothetical protein